MYQKRPSSDCWLLIMQVLFIYFFVSFILYNANAGCFSMYEVSMHTAVQVTRVRIAKPES